MKIMKKFTFFALAAALVCAGCEKNDNGGKEPNDPTKLVYGGVTYNLVTLADGNTWMAENLRYVPEGMTVSSDPADGSGLWYPAGADKVADPSLAETKGLLYNADVAFGTAVTAENAVSMEGVRGICPEGWHIPTLGDCMGLVGKCAKINFAIAGYDYAVGSAPTDPNAICYDATIDGAPVDKLNEIGWNWTNAGVVNVTNVANISKGAYLVTVYEDIVGAMSYVLGSTCYQVQTNDDGSVKNIQYTSLMSTINKSNNKVTVAFGNFKSGYSVRCVKNK